MTTYLLTYHGGEMPGSDEEREQSRVAWDEWFAALGPAVVVAGDPIGLVRTVHPDGTVNEDGGADPVGGYSVIAADGFDEALQMVSDCPIFEVGGSIQVGETIPTM